MINSDRRFNAETSLQDAKNVLASFKASYTGNDLKADFHKATNFDYACYHDNDSFWL